MSYARCLSGRQSGFCHSVVTSLVMPVLASSALRRTLGVSVILILLLEQILPLVFTPLNMTCELYFERFTLVRTVVMMLALWVVEWLAAVFIIILLRNSTFYLPESRLHSCTVCYAIVLFTFRMNGSFFLIEFCSSDHGIRSFSQFINSVTSGASTLACGLQIQLTRLKMQLMAEAVPKAARVGGAVADAALFFLLLASVFHVWRVNFRKQLAVLCFNFAAVGSGLCYATFSGIYLWVMEFLARSATEEAAQVDVDVRTASSLVRAARWTRFVAATSLAAFLSTMCWCASAVFRESLPKMMWGSEYYVFLLDSVLNLMCVALHSGIAFPDVMPADVWSLIQVSATAVDAQRRRQIERRLRDDLGDSSGSALTIAVLMEGVPPEKILEVGRNRFRCICWDTLARRREIIVGGSPLDECGPAEPDLYSLSRPCRLGQCDVFYSHSWHESGQWKWEALTAWCSEFERSNGRKPRIWLDKVCVDQANIDVELQSLPVFLAGCNTLFATSGSTYRSRLWCLMELLVYRMMLVADPGRSPPQVWMLGKDDEHCERQRQEWGRVDVNDAKCFNPRDKERFLRVVSMYPGGAEGFNAFIHDLAVGFEKFVPKMY